MGGGRVTDLQNKPIAMENHMGGLSMSAFLRLRAIEGD